MTKQADIKKKQEQLAKQLKNICNETGRPREKDIVAVVRGAVRKAWSRSPTKLSLLMMRAVHVSDVPEDKLPPKLSKVSKWLYECEMCHEYFIQSKIECDHKKGENSLKTYDDMVGFTNSILNVCWDDLSLLCIPCHSAKTYSQRYGISIEDAWAEKEVIAIMNSGTEKQKAFLKKRGVVPSSTIDKRRDQIREVLKGERE